MVIRNSLRAFSQKADGISEIFQQQCDAIQSGEDLKTFYQFNSQNLSVNQKLLIMRKNIELYGQGKIFTNQA